MYDMTSDSILDICNRADTAALRKMAPVDGMLVAFARAVIYAERLGSGLDAARIAYASEFEFNDEGEPDVGNIHANIRNIKAQLSAMTAAPTDDECTRACQAAGFRITPSSEKDMRKVLTKFVNSRAE